MQGLINQNLYPIYIKIQEPTLERLFMEAKNIDILKKELKNAGLELK